MPGQQNNSRDALDVEVAFPDKNLDAAVREAVEKPEGPLTKGDLRLVEVLSTSKRSAALNKDLASLEYPISVTALNLLRVGEIKKISQLALMTNLITLDLSGNQISDAGPLESLTDMDALDLSSNYIEDISALESLTNLIKLDLSFNAMVSDISPLESLTSLTEVDLGHNWIGDISPLQSLTNLTYLRLQHNNIEDISPLESLNNLIKVDLSNNQISDFTPLSSRDTLTNSLRELEFAGNPLSQESIEPTALEFESIGVVATVFGEPWLRHFRAVRRTAARLRQRR